MKILDQMGLLNYQIDESYGYIGILNFETNVTLLSYKIF